MDLGTVKVSVCVHARPCAHTFASPPRSCSRDSFVIAHPCRVSLFLVGLSCNVFMLATLRIDRRCWMPRRAKARIDSPSEFEENVLLTFDNAMTYNPPTHDG